MGDKIKLLMVDDEKDLTMIMKSNLEFSGKFEVVASNDPLNVEELIEREKPNVILLDVVMPQRKGSEIAQALKQNLKTKDIPIIMVSGRGEMVYHKKQDNFKWEPNRRIVAERGTLPEGRSAEALSEAYGVDDYIAKPFSTELLIQVIEGVLEKKAQHLKEQGEGSPDF
ncbi:MAG: response regulator [Candidatus Omnitrophota bacterium]|jgi:CheY-like chemotaxis protein